MLNTRHWRGQLKIRQWLKYEQSRRPLTYRGGPHPRYVLCVSSFLRPPHVRDFVKEGYFFCTQVRGMVTILITSVLIQNTCSFKFHANPLYVEAISRHYITIFNEIRVIHLSPNILFLSPGFIDYIYLVTSNKTRVTQPQLLVRIYKFANNSLRQCFISVSSETLYMLSEIWEWADTHVVKDWAIAMNNYLFWVNMFCVIIFTAYSMFFVISKRYIWLL